MPMDQFRKRLILDMNQKRAKYMQIVIKDDEEEK